MLKQRIITALILAPLMLLGIITLPVQEFSIFMGIIILLGAREWARLSNITDKVPMILFVLAIGLGCYLSRELIPRHVFSVAVIWWFVVFTIVKNYPESGQWIKNSYVRLVMGALTLIPAWLAFVSLKQRNDGVELIGLLFAIIWAADIGAFFSGKRFGRIKLLERVSPNKTLEGLVGGLLCAVLMVSIISLWGEVSFIQSVSLLMLTIMTALVSVLGDLWESVLKRESGMKDSGTLLPGHGGVLDRIDSVLAAAPFFAMYVIIFRGL